MDLSHEIRHSLRSLLRRRSYPLIVVLTLALGIGSATAIYNVVWWHLFRAVPAPPGVYLIGTLQKDGTATPFVPPPLVAPYTAPSDAIERCALAMHRSMNVVVERSPATSKVVVVSAGFFRMLGISPAMGRLFQTPEFTDGRNPVVVVSYGFWKAHLGGRSDALGRTIKVGRDRCEVVGVLREGQGFSTLAWGDVFRPFTYRFDPRDAVSDWPVVFAQLRAGVTPAQAEAALASDKVDLPEAMKSSLSDSRPMILTIRQADGFFRSDAYGVLVGAVAFLYLIACLNATNLMLGQFLSRHREMAVRLALGGSRAGVVRLVLIEATALAVGGAVVGSLIANWLAPLFFVLAGRESPENGWISWNLSAGTYAVLAGLAVVAAVATSLAPAAFLARSGGQNGLRAGSGSGGESRPLRRVRGALVVLQASLAVILLVGTGLMIRTFQRIEHIRLGFQPAHRVKIVLDFPNDPNLKGRKLADRANTALDRLREALLRVPGALSAAASSSSMLDGFDGITSGIRAADGSAMKVADVYASPDFSRTGGLTILRGHWFEPGSKTDVVINESLARKRFPGLDPIGQYLVPSGVGQIKGFPIVGVVADVRESVHLPPTPTVYMPVRWDPWMASSFVVEFQQNLDAGLLSKIREAIYSENPEIVVFSVTPMDRLLGRITSDEHLTLSVFRVLSGIAWALALIGLYSIMAYTVDRRMGEFGIRTAVGATPGHLMALVLRRGVFLASAGVLLGTGGALALAHFIQSLLYEAPPFDGIVVMAVALLLLLSGVLACLPPAVRASRPNLATFLKQVD